MPDSDSMTRFGRWVERHIKPHQTILAAIAALGGIVIILAGVFGWNVLLPKQERGTQALSSAPRAASKSERVGSMSLSIQDPATGAWGLEVSVGGYRPAVVLLIEYRNPDSQIERDVTFKIEHDSSLVAGVAGGTTFGTQAHPQGVPATGDLWGAGINLGNYAQGGGTWIVGRGTLLTETFPCNGSTTVSLRASKYVGESDQASYSGQVLVHYSTPPGWVC